jgi:hypothetical protein
MAAVLVMGFCLAVAGQALAGTELQQTFRAAKQNGENLVEVVRLALQSGADLAEVAAAADGAGIAADIVTAAALAAGLKPPQVARAVESNSDSNLGYQAPASSGPLSSNETTSGATEVAGTSFDNSLAVAKTSSDKPKPCPPGQTSAFASTGEACCNKDNSDLPLCP